MTRRQTALIVAGSLAAALGAGALLASCDQSKLVGSLAVPAASGGLIQVTAADDPTLAGTSLQLAPGDLAADTVITVSRAPDLLAEEPRPAGPAARWEPAGLTLVHSALMTLPLALGPGQSRADVQLAGADAQGRLFRLAPSAINDAGTFVSFLAPRLGTYQAVAIVRCPDGTGCPAEEICRPSHECGPPVPVCVGVGCPCPCTSPLVCREDECRLPLADGG